MADNVEQQQVTKPHSVDENSSEGEKLPAAPARPDGASQGSEAETEEKKPSKFKETWKKVGLDAPTLMMMFKGSLAPTIAIAMYQSPRVANEFSTLGYLVAIMSLIAFPIMPRGKYIQNISLNVLAVCLSAAVQLLGLYGATQARKHTAPPGASPTAYNASASAVCGVWLIWQVYLISYLRAARPQFQFQAIVYSIFVIVSTSYGPSFPTMAYAISFMKRLLEAFLTGFGLATGVHFLVFPLTSRMVIFKQMTGYIGCLSGLLQAQKAYMRSLEDIDPVALREKLAAEAEEASKEGKKGRHQGSSKATPGTLTTPAAEAMNAVFLQLLELHSKLNLDLPSAKREFALGKLESKDIKEMWNKMRLVFVPIIGLHSMIDILQRRAEQRGWANTDLPEDELKKNREQIESLHNTLKALHEPFDAITQELEAGFQHILITLELTKPPKQKDLDEENQGDRPAPGSLEFAESLKNKVDSFYESRKMTLTAWCESKGVQLPPDYFDQSHPSPEGIVDEDSQVPEEFRHQLYFVLYMEYTLYRTGQAVLDMVLWADKVKQDGKLSKRRLIFPGSKTMYKWFRSIFSQEDFSDDDNFGMEASSGRANSSYLGEAFGKRKDPEHLPPTNTRERIGEAIRLIPKFFRSENSAFGLRVVAATMSIAIVGYLRDSQQFYLTQRILWAEIMIAISMSRLQGASTFNFLLRIIGTAIAMVASYIIWYIVDGKTPGVIVFLWLWMTCGFYFVVKFPKYVIVAILSVVTSLLVIGYELQVKVLGVAASTSNGQPAYPTYELAPYRLAMVSGGLLVAWIWTIWPYPVSESSELRKDLGGSLYLLANFYEVVHQVVRSRVTGVEGDVSIKGTHAYNLEKARAAIFARALLVVNNLRTNSAFSKFQVKVGGRFPNEEYEGLIECVQRILNYTALISYASQTFSLGDTPAEEKSKWSNDFRRLTANVSSTSHRITSTLSLLSSSLINAQALPPYLEMPRPFEFIRKLESIDHDILSIRHIVEPEYAAFAVIQLCGGAIVRDIEKLTGHVKALVGEIDFSFHALATDGNSLGTSSSDDVQDGKAKAA